MYKTGSLLLVSILTVVLMAPPARSQNTKDQLNDIIKDLIELKAQVKAMQDNSDRKNTEMKAVLDQIIARFVPMEANIQKLGTSLSEIKTSDEKSAEDLRQAKAAVNALKDTFDKLDLGQNILDIKLGIGGIKTQISNLQITESPLPTPRQAYDSAYGLLSQGFFDDAITEFRDFIKAYPKDPKAVYAQLEIGNAYFTQKKFPQALVEYDLAIQTYPESDKKCTALYKKGQTHALLKENPKATAAFQEVVRACPGSSEALFAADELKKLPKGARGQ
jgi:tol-pal system protein YbgF